MTAPPGPVGRSPPERGAADPFPILVDCPRCRVEAAVVEIVDPADGTTLESRCRVCGRLSRAGEPVDPGRDLADAAAARAALARFAAEEGEDDLDRFCRASFGGLATDEVVRRLVAGEPVPSNLDVFAWLFPGMAAAGAPTVRAGPVGDAPRPAVTGVFTHQRTRDPREVAAVAARAMAAVMVADGHVTEQERAYVDRFLSAAGLAPLRDEDLRGWRPGELAVPEDPRPVVEAMLRLVFLDGDADPTEWQVVREYARSWGYPLDRLEDERRRFEAAFAPGWKRLLRALRSLFIREESP